ncbi:hypothetical protein QRD43_20605 [Pelomonas sp. APW6]|uniref:Uncharacterized protein n=1 Tax=Roseateles subflavus TaxID=3053353 RepID=A0ABT7LQ93_9BURK|nr:hypothetical protein [Pelomonas sp. APW6]MDL5034315.1 hypothetical protein [Pelomonas sp. APW6]
MSMQRIEDNADLRQALPTFSVEELLDEAQFTFGYYGNALHNLQVERQDDAIERFCVVKAELARRLSAMN